MNQLNNRESRTIAAHEAVLLALLLVVVGGGSLLLSAAESTRLVDGALRWREDSLLRAVVGLLCLEYRFPTINADEVKNYLLGLGAGLSVLVLTLAVVIRQPGADDPNAGSSHSVSIDGPGREGLLLKAHLAPVVAAQVLVGFYVLWSFASNGWSAAPELAKGGTFLLAIFLLWALCLGYTLGPRAVWVAIQIILVVSLVCSSVAVWYYYGRNPVIRAKFPFGNPSFLAACLIPGMLLSVTGVCETAAALRQPGFRVAVWGRFIVLLLVLAISGWAFWLSDTRGAYVGLASGLLAIPFFAVRGRLRWIPVGLAIALTVGTWFYFSQDKDQASLTGRSETIRLREYAWSYAMDMFNDRPLTGHGQGGYVLAGDDHAVKDVLHDPLVFGSRIAHAHNEWLEVMADLGAVGIVLIAGALFLTLRAGALTLDQAQSPEHSWQLVGLVAALVALTIEECFGVGLRVAGVPTWFYTVLGLVWAACRRSPSPLVSALSRAGWTRTVTGAVGVTTAALTLTVVQADFADARNAHSVEQLIRTQEYDEAIGRAQRGVNRLSPQRRLEGLYRLSEAQMLIARALQQRADDRESRARQTAVPDPHLIELADEDRVQSDEYCRNGSATLRELVRRSPGYLNHGWIAYWLNLTQANNADARGEEQQREQFVAAALAASATELQRQPFDASLAECFARAGYGTVALPEILEVLARPLRYHRIPVYVGLLQDLASDKGFDALFAGTLNSARRALEAPPGEWPPPIPVGKDATGSAPPELWAPEKMRLSAALHFLKGDYRAARADMELAAEGYRRLGDRVSLGAAACFEELAQCRFVDNPQDPKSAVESADRAITLAPESEPGRALKAGVVQRMIEYRLSAAEEDLARELLRRTGPTGVSEEEVSDELAARYRQLCQLFLARRREGGVLPQPVRDLLPELRRWIARSIELNATDPMAHYLAADLSFYARDDVSTADHLRSALQYGLPPAEAQQFLSVTRAQMPDSTALNAVWDTLQSLEEDRSGSKLPTADPAPEGPNSPLGRAGNSP